MVKLGKVSDDGDENSEILRFDGIVVADMMQLVCNLTGEESPAKLLRPSVINESMENNSGRRKKY